MNQPIKVRVKIAVYKFFCHEDNFGSAKVELRKTDRFGEIIARSLSKIDDDTLKQNVEFPKWYLDRQRFKTITITPLFPISELAYNEHNIYSLSVLLEELFNTSFYMYMKGRMEKLPNEVESVERFMEEYTIDTKEFKFDAFKKRFQRFRWKSLEKMKNKKTIVPTLQKPVPISQKPVPISG